MRNHISGIQQYDSLNSNGLLLNIGGQRNHISISNLQDFFKSLSQNQLIVYVSNNQIKNLRNQHNYSHKNSQINMNNQNLSKPNNSSNYSQIDEVTCCLNKDFPNIWIFLLSNLSKERYLHVSPQFFQMLPIISISTLITYHHILSCSSFSQILNSSFYDSMKTFLNEKSSLERKNNPFPRTKINFKYSCSAPTSPNIRKPLSFLQQKKMLNQRSKPSMHSKFAINMPKLSENSFSNSKALSLSHIQSCNDEQFFSINSQLYFSSETAASNYQKLQEYKISHIISLNNISIRFPNQFEYIQLNLKDSPFEDLPQEFWSLSFKIEQIIKAGGRILVHCRRGFSRSPSLCLLYLMDIQKMSFSNAYDKIKQIHPGIQINNGYLQQLRDHEI